jgi:hypothetical protein
MKYEVDVQVVLRPSRDAAGFAMAGGQLELRESRQIELTTLSDAAMLLVKLHEFFEALKARKP